jgi:hypothetical protein
VFAILGQAGQHERVQVRGDGDRLRRDERRRALNQVGHRDGGLRIRRWFVDGLRDPEVEHLHEVVVLAIPAQEDVCRLDVAMHEPARFGFGQRIEPM